MWSRIGLLIVPFLVLASAPDGVDAAPVRVPHAPVLITSNAGFGNSALCLPNLANGVIGGCGTSSNPWRIEGWNFISDCCLFSGIDLSGTTQYVRIADNSFTLGWGISLTGADNVIIQGNDFVGARALWINDASLTVLSSHIQFVDNTAVSAAGAIHLEGIGPSYSIQDVTIEGNTLSGSTAEAIHAQDVTGMTITGNTITGNKDGISCPFGGCGGVTIADNDISGNTGTAINGRWSSAIVRDNLVQNNLRGITGCVAHTVPEIYGNNIAGNTDWGVSLQSCTVDATDNWWGDASGPSGLGSGSGDKLLHSGSGGVVFDPWLTAANPNAGP